jgi:hypothetical protein
MEPLEVDSPQVHDLLQLDPDSSQLACTDAPDCVAPAVASCPWVSVNVLKRLLDRLPWE